MANVVVVGAQWGDEGKGKSSTGCRNRPTRSSASRAGTMPAIRWHRGPDLQAVPAPLGRRAAGKLSVIGNGVVLDPHALIAEVEKLRGQGVPISRDNLRVADNVTLILSVHRDLDALRESSKRGDGHRHHQAGHRAGLRGQGRPARHPLMDLADLETLPAKIDRLLAHHNALRRGSGCPSTTPAPSTTNWPRSHPRCCPTWTRCGSSSTTSGALASASCSRARRARCWTSTTAPIPSSHRPTRWRGRPRQARAWAAGHRLRARHRQGLHHARRRRPLPHRAGQRDRQPDRRAGPRVRHRHGRKRRCGWFDSCSCARP